MHIYLYYVKFRTFLHRYLNKIPHFTVIDSYSKDDNQLQSEIIFHMFEFYNRKLKDNMLQIYIKLFHDMILTMIIAVLNNNSKNVLYI